MSVDLISIEEYLPDDMLVEMLGDVFAGMFGEAHDPPYPSFDDSAATAVLPVHGQVRVTGGWHGNVAFSCTDDFARSAAAILFGLDLSEVADADALDVVGEIANVIGGNVKSLMPGPSVLSLPVTSLCADLDRGSGALAGTVPAAQIDLVWVGQPLRVTVAIGDDVDGGQREEGEQQ